MQGLSVKLNGSIQAIQSDVDFYLRLTSVAGMKSLKTLRKDMFEKFERDEDLRYYEEYKRLHPEEYEDENKDAEFQEGIQEKQSEEQFEDEPTFETVGEAKESFSLVKEYVSHGVFLDSNEPNTSVIEDVSSNPQVSEVHEYVSHGVYLEDVLASIKIEQEQQAALLLKELVNENIEYVSHGVYLEDIDSEVESESIEEKVTPYSDDSSENQFAPHGVYLEDISFDDEEEKYGKYEFEQECGFTESEEDGDFVSHGVYLEDLDFSANLEEPQQELEDYGEDSYAEDEEFEGTDEEDSWLGEDSEDDGEDSWGYDEEESENSEDDGSWGYDEGASGSLEADDDDSWGYDDEDSEEGFSEDGANDTSFELENVISKQEETFTKSELDNEKEEIREEKEEEQKIDVPKDLRDFVRQNPGKTIQYIQQFYSNKEIQKQLMLGRVFKRNGKLSI